MLAAAGRTFDDVVDVTYPEANVSLVLAAMREAFPSEPLPNVTAVGVNWLAGFQLGQGRRPRATRKGARDHRGGRHGVRVCLPSFAALRSAGIA